MDDSSSHTAAKASRFCGFFIIGMLYLARRDGTLRGVGEISMILMAPGLLLGIYALFGIRHYGAKGILAPALTGIAINGTLLLIFGTSIFAARLAAFAHTGGMSGLNSADWTSIDANTPGSYRSESLSFDYPDSYELKKNNQTGQISLRYAKSTVVITCLPKTDDMVETLKDQVSRMEPALRNQSSTNFAQTDAEKIDGTIRSGYLIRMEYDDPTEGRLHADAYLLSAAANNISVLHIYPDTINITAGPLFRTVLRSLMNGPVTSPVSAKPATIQAAVPAATPTRKGPPELTSIMWIPTRPSAQLDKSFAFEGDHVRGYKVTKISHDSVDLLTPEGASLKLVLAAQAAGK